MAHSAGGELRSQLRNLDRYRSDIVANCVLCCGIIIWRSIRTLLRNARCGRKPGIKDKQHFQKGEIISEELPLCSACQKRADPSSRDRWSAKG